ncbi:MAG: hypothetical protein CME88_03590 [Hirschia sp.]|nr:hypothetical protein [Hirschia sp.]MBF17439.1 hypothetical protein [Hirschia sp.]
MHGIFKGALALIGCALSLALPTQAQHRFEPSPDCMMKENYFRSSGLFSTSYSYTLEAAILTWYVQGPEAIVAMDSGSKSNLAQCIDPNGSLDCGLEPDKKTYNALMKGVVMKKGDAKKIRKYFSQPVPDAAIALASRAVGRCFGDHPAQPSMEEMGFIPMEISNDDCFRIAEVAFENRPSGQSIYRTWSSNIYRNVRLKPKIDNMCTFIQKDALDTYKASVAEEEAKRLRLASRSVEERTQGLTGCEIAYGLVFNGINKTSDDPIPDGALSWALKYEQDTIDGFTCPAMPEVLADWVDRQPLETFEAAPDPFDSFVQRGAPGGTYAAWDNFYGRLMMREQRDGFYLQDITGGCSEFLSWAGQKSFAGKKGSNNADNIMLQYLKQMPPQAKPVACKYVPTTMIHWFRTDPERQRQAEIAAERARESAQREARRKAWEAQIQAIEKAHEENLRNRPISSSNEPRCYAVETTKYGTRERCFHD